MCAFGFGSFFFWFAGYGMDGRGRVMPASGLFGGLVVGVWGRWVERGGGGGRPGFLIMPNFIWMCRLLVLVWK